MRHTHECKTRRSYQLKERYLLNVSAHTNWGILELAYYGCRRGLLNRWRQISIIYLSTHSYTWIASICHVVSMTHKSKCFLLHKCMCPQARYCILSINSTCRYCLEIEIISTNMGRQFCKLEFCNMHAWCCHFRVHYTKGLLLSYIVVLTIQITVIMSVLLLLTSDVRSQFPKRIPWKHKSVTRCSSRFNYISLNFMFLQLNATWI